MMKKGSKTEMLREMKPGQKPITLKLTSTEECSTYGTLASRFNNIKGKKMGKYIHVSIDYMNCMVHLVCSTYDEYLKEKAHLLPKQWWKKQIPQKKINPFSHKSHP